MKKLEKVMFLLNVYFCLIEDIFDSIFHNFLNIKFIKGLYCFILYTDSIFYIKVVYVLANSY